jgi:hypothetical protein
VPRGAGGVSPRMLTRGANPCRASSPDPLSGGSASRDTGSSP